MKAITSFRFLSVLAALGVFLSFTTSLRAADMDFRTPDKIVLKNGNEVRGLIVSNTARDVTIQSYNDEQTYPKSEIIRIIDNANPEFTAALDQGELPSWQVIVNDLRTLDSVKSLVQIPATRIDSGVFANVPYMSFRVNKSIEINIYGDPRHPAGIEFGIYGSKSGDQKLQRILRSYLVGFLTSRDEIAAMYEIGLEQGEKQVGNLVMEVTPRTADDAFGAWWLSIYNVKLLSQVTLSDAEYKKLTVPAESLLTAKGEVQPGEWTPQQDENCARPEALENDSQVILRGFYRDKNGMFRLLGDMNQDG
ncbi:MAG: hypothetical protein ACK5LK_09835 [Chthoniobacterales bacterium]